jgi:hypothetical protein
LCLTPINYLYVATGLFTSLPSRLSNVLNDVITSVPSLVLFDNAALLYNSYFTLGNSITTSTSSPSEEATQESVYPVSTSNLRSVDELSSTGLNENSSDQRFMRFMNPVFKYDFKVGNYMPDDAKKLNPHMFMTIKDVTTGIRKSS